MKTKEFNYTHRPCDVFPAGVGELTMTYRTHLSVSRQLRQSIDVTEFIKEEIYAKRDDIEYRESFHVLFLNRTNRLIGFSTVSEGSAAGTVVDPRMIFQRALMSHASAIVLTHNHPSGTKEPSEADKLLTKKILQGGKLLEITILDHVIVTKTDFYSFADNGIL